VFVTGFTAARFNFEISSLFTSEGNSVATVDVEEPDAGIDS
jgi:hypothetical protein